MPTFDLLDHLLWDFWLYRDASNTYTREPNGLKLFKYGSISDWDNLDNGSELYLAATMLTPMRWEGKNFVGSESYRFV